MEVKWSLSLSEGGWFPVQRLCLLGQSSKAVNIGRELLVDNLRYGQRRLIGMRSGLTSKENVENHGLFKEDTQITIKQKNCISRGKGDKPGSIWIPVCFP